MNSGDPLRYLPPARFDVRGGSGRSPVSTINDFASDPSRRRVTLLSTARGSLLPVLYGRRDVEGRVFAAGKIGTDLVVGVRWCYGEIDAIEAVYINNAVLPVGVTATHYTGTASQTANATLQSAIPGYNDSMRFPSANGGLRGIAYSVLRIPAGAIETSLTIRGVLRGLKLYDPRTDSVAYSDNSALAMGDWIRDADYGLGRVVVGGWEACADRADSLIGDALPRSRLALLIEQGRAAEEYLTLFGEYAEAYFVQDGDGYRLIPDAPVDLSAVPVIGPDDIIEGSYTFSPRSDLDAPTEIEGQYTDPPDPVTEPWAMSTIAPQSLPGVATGEVTRVPTSIVLQGVYRYAECVNKAAGRLQRAHGQCSYGWTTPDLGVRYQRGDVVRVTLPQLGVDAHCRIMGRRLVGGARYAITAERYAASDYPDELQLPENEGIIPEGAIVMLSGGTVPDGWAAFTAADGRYILGAGGAANPGDTGGSATVSPFFGNTTSDGFHDGPADLPRPRLLSGGTSGNFGGGNVGGEHLHSWSVAAFTPALYRREQRLIIKVGDDDIRFPASVQIWGLPNLAGSHIIKIVDRANRYLYASATTANAGTQTLTVSATVGGASDAHGHTSFSPDLDGTTIGEEPAAKASVYGGGEHAHDAVLTVSANLRRAQICLFGSSGDAMPAYPGVIIAWVGALDDLPEGWVLCDGAAGTPDLRDCFIQFAAATPTPPAGDNALSLSGGTNEVGHSHDGGDVAAGRSSNHYAHGAEVRHSHGISAATTWLPPWYALAFLMYAPGH